MSIGYSTNPAKSVKYYQKRYGGDIMPKRNYPIAAQIGKRIYQKRKELGLTQEELADRSGLSQSFLTCIERGEKGLGFDSIIRISCALETSTDYLLMGVMSQEETDYIHSMFKLMDESQRKDATAIMRHLLNIAGHTPPKQ